MFILRESIDVRLHWTVAPHIRGLMHRRFRLLKRIGESDEWHNYLPYP